MGKALYWWAECLHAQGTDLPEIFTSHPMLVGLVTVARFSFPNNYLVGYNHGYQGAGFPSGFF